MLKILKKYKYLISIIIIIVIIIVFILRSKSLKKANNEIELIQDLVIEKEEKIEIPNKMKVDIKGQVLYPGVYEMDEDTRIIDVIEKAGGLTEIANTSLINLSKKIEDGMVIIIYSNEEVLNSNVKEIETVFKIIEKECVCPNIKNDGCVNSELEDNNTNEENKMVNINTASLEELMTLSGVGESKAKAIIEYRETNKFNTIEDIKNVSGIGDALFESIKSNISV